MLRRLRNEKVQKHESVPYDGLDEEGQQHFEKPCKESNMFLRLRVSGTWI